MQKKTFTTLDAMAGNQCKATVSAVQSNVAMASGMVPMAKNWEQEAKQLQEKVAELERRLAEAAIAEQKLRDAAELALKSAERRGKERDDLRSKVERLEEAGDELEDAAGSVMTEWEETGRDHMDTFMAELKAALQSWREAKQTK